MRIGELAGRVGVSTRALRYYEEQGLLRSQRTASGQRLYPDSSVDRVRLIRQLYTAGLSSALIAVLLPAIDARHVDPELMGLLVQERERIRDKVAGLQEAGRRLDVLIGLAAHPDARPCPGSLGREESTEASGSAAPGSEPV
ncbi:MerR family transcriptional regulator [Nocardiopsis ganjiahuensis]|uniref:MerR family transcriptional regulator n=1 Tax=Nocardiopsis ganjiahuensis TaxID=239984 RepID=UPI000594B154|nr:MerR family transcriptional regulator [Nocardiopsis ganjiahuensis]